MGAESQICQMKNYGDLFYIDVNILNTTEVYS